MASLNTVLSKTWITKALIRLHICAGWSTPVLYSTPEDRFSRDKAHITIRFYHAEAHIHSGESNDRRDSLPSKFIKALGYWAKPSGSSLKPKRLRWTLQKGIKNNFEFSLKCVTYWTCFAERCCLSLSEKPSKHAYMGSATGLHMGPIWGCPDGSHITAT